MNVCHFKQSKQIFHEVIQSVFMNVLPEKKIDQYRKCPNLVRIKKIIIFKDGTLIRIKKIFTKKSKH